MSYSLEVKQKSVLLRQQGYSIREIAKKMRISVSTTSIWLSKIKIGTKAQQRLLNRKILGQQKANKTRKIKQKHIIWEIQKRINKELETIVFNSSMARLICSMLFWAEGNKSLTNVSFTNSDPNMIRIFLVLLRKSFVIDEQKLRVLIHIHEYHNEDDLKKFWSKVTNIPLSQFNRSFKKAHTKKRVKVGYKGSCRIRYYDAQIAKELTIIYNTYVKNIGV